MGTEQSHLLDSFMTTTIGFTRMGLSTFYDIYRMVKKTIVTKSTRLL